ncbi:type II toxin-antitoxin system HicB family antitoxin [Microcoleus sp. N9_A1]|uniref:type II toxin-antitoxin system HicB family antitoxin n=1 Tax=Microcoleus sp. N9_A1 TaxID=3055380 RepID=UPI004040B8BC
MRSNRVFIALVLEKYLNKYMKIRAIVHPAEEGGYWAEVPGLPGCITEGETIEEVIINLKDAIEGWLEVANSREAIDSTDRVVEIAV